MNILITGASGFLGTAFLEYIRKENLFTKDNIILLTSREIEGYKCIRHKGYTFIRDDFIEQGIDKIDILFHMGSSVPHKSEEFGTDYAYKYSENIINTAWLMGHIPSLPKKIIYISTVSIYKPDKIISESTPIQTTDMYGASKYMCEVYLEHLAKEKDIMLQILRLGQIYGEGEERYSKIVSTFTKQIAMGKPVTVFGTGKEKRSMLYIGDCVKYIVAAAQLERSQGPVNIVSGEPISILDIIRLVADGCGRKEIILLRPDIQNQSVYYDATQKEILFHIKETDYRTGILNYCKYYMRKCGEKL